MSAEFIQIKNQPAIKQVANVLVTGAGSCVFWPKVNTRSGFK